MRRKAVTQGMRRNILVDVRLFLIILDDLPEALTRHTFAGNIDKKRLLRRHSDHFRTDILHIIRHRLKRLGIQRNDANLAVSGAADKAAGQADIIVIEIDQLTDPNTGRVQQLQHGLVAVALHIRAFRLFEQKLDLLAAQDLRQLLFGLLQLDVMYGILVDLVLVDGEEIEAFERGQRA